MNNEKKQNLPVDIKKLIKRIEKKKYVLIVLLVGLLIILWPSSGGNTRTTTEQAPRSERVGGTPMFSLEEEEVRIAQALSQIAGAGEVSVLLTLHTSLEQEVAVNEDSSGRRETVTVQAGAGTQSEVTLRYTYPRYQGALIVAEGADDATVRLQITQAVAALTGLGTDRITVTPMG